MSLSIMSLLSSLLALSSSTTSLFLKVNIVDVKIVILDAAVDKVVIPSLVMSSLSFSILPINARRYTGHLGMQSHRSIHWAVGI